MRRRDIEVAGVAMRGPGEGLRRIPRLSMAERLALEAILLAGGRSLSEVEFSGVNGGVGYCALWWKQAGVLRGLIREGLVEVMSLGPAVYRVTKLGEIARRRAK